MQVRAIVIGRTVSTCQMYAQIVGTSLSGQKIPWTEYFGLAESRLTHAVDYNDDAYMYASMHDAG